MPRTESWDPEMLLEQSATQCRAPRVRVVLVRRCTVDAVAGVFGEEDFARALADVARTDRLLAPLEDSSSRLGVCVECLADHRSSSRRMRKTFGGSPNSGSSNGGRPLRSRSCTIAALIRCRTRKRVSASAECQLSARTYSTSALGDSIVIVSRNV